MHNKGIAAIQADGSAINISLLIFFSFGLTVLQLRFCFKCKFRLLIYISAGRTEY